VLNPVPGREEDARYWLDALSVNRAIMRAIEASEPSWPVERHFPESLRRRDGCRHLRRSESETHAG
jgi:hypothetical protein